MWDYDKLFAEDNIVGLTIDNGEDVYNQVVSNPDYWEDGQEMNWNLYKNEELSSCEETGFKFEIQYIIRLDEHGNVVEKLFDRDRDMAKPMPELETGMFVLIFNYNHTETRLGYINAERNMVIYQTGGWDYIDKNKDEILKIYSDSCNCFDGCSKQRVIWRNPEYQKYLDSKSN